VIINCLHTGRGNIALFDAAARAAEPGLVLHHHVRADLLAEAETAGGLIPAIAAKTQDALRTLIPGADAVILNCTTLGPAVAPLQHDARVPLLRSDAPLAAQAMREGRNVVVLCTVPATLASTQQLFTDAAKGTRARFEIRLLAEAWPLFQGGDTDGYYRRIAQAADLAFTQGADLVALAQASMAPAADLVQRGRPLTVPATCLAAVVEALPPKAKARC